MEFKDETYLGDGLYVSFDGWHVILRAPRGGIDHWIGMEPEVLARFQRYIVENFTPAKGVRT